MMLPVFTGLAVIACASLASTSENPMASFNQAVGACKTQFPVTNENLEALQKNATLLDEDDQDSRCFVQCMMTRMELVDSKAQFDAAKAKQFILQRLPMLYGRPGSDQRPAQSAVDTAVDECYSTIRGDGLCMLNYRIWSCMHSKLHRQN